MATIKQKLAISKIVENRGNISKAMREAGYDDTTCKNPKNLTESKGYKKATEPFVKQLEEQRRIAISKLNETIDKAQYHQLVEGIDKFTKLIQLLNGDPTERNEVKIEGIEYIVPDENNTKANV